jgi:hypothetical protein
MRVRRGIMKKAKPHVVGGCLAVAFGGMLADGTETLGAPGIQIESGTGLFANGAGMISQPGTLTVEVPAGASVRQVLLYWEGFMATNTAGDETTTVAINGGAGVPVTGTLKIGGPTFFF